MLLPGPVLCDANAHDAIVDCLSAQSRLFVTRFGFFLMRIAEESQFCVKDRSSVGDSERLDHKFAEGAAEGVEERASRHRRRPLGLKSTCTRFVYAAR